MDLLNSDRSGARLSEYGGTFALNGLHQISCDALGNRVSMEVTMPSAPIYSGTTSYSYAEYSELGSESSTRGGYSRSYAYDAAGNPTAMRVPGSLLYNADNQLIAADYVYDGNGNPTTYRGRTATYDPENRLVSLEYTPGSLMHAGYNADGLRAWESDPVRNTRYTLYDGDSPVAELDGRGNLLAVNTFGADGLAARFTYGTAGDAGTGSESFYCFDPQGSVAEIVGSGGSVLGSFAIDAYGARTGTGATNEPYAGFGGQWGYYDDAATSLTLCGHRAHVERRGASFNCYCDGVKAILAGLGAVAGYTGVCAFSLIAGCSLGMAGAFW